MQPQPRQIHVKRRGRSLKPAENQSQTRCVSRLDACFRASQKESLEAFVPEFPDH
jgi:hypothetical protein